MDTKLDSPLSILPGSWHVLPDAARCPACAGRLAYSVGRAYIACPACGFQRRLAGAVAIHAALVASGLTLVGPALLAELAALPPDGLPPAPALLWRPLGPDLWAGPSASAPYRTHFVTCDGAATRCTCPGGQYTRPCWHRLWVAALRARQAPAAPTLEAQVADLYGTAA